MSFAVPTDVEDARIHRSVRAQGSAVAAILRILPFNLASALLVLGGALAAAVALEQALARRRAAEAR